jgi:hypothetical protein
MNTSILFKTSAIVEVLAGLAFLFAPTLVVGLLLGEGLNPIGIAIARVLGIGLLSLGVAAWESPEQENRLAPRAGLCLYNIGIAVLLAIFGTTGGMHAPLLWPVAGLHGLIGVVMLCVIFPRMRSDG